MACYLGQYKFKSEMLTKYFQDYKYQKVINKVLKEFDQTVKEQAVKREYNTILQARSSIVESIDRTGAQTYFLPMLWGSSILHSLWLNVTMKALWQK